MAAIAVTAGSLLLASCGGGGGGIGGTGSSQTGTMHLSITDAPACGYDAVNVTIERVRVHKSSSAEDADSGWSEVLVRPAEQRVDLLTLTNGVLKELGQTTLPAGKYTQMRLVLAPNNGSNPPANSVVPTGGTETALTTPSAQQSGIKLNVDIDIPADKVADFVLDFDACKSIVKRGNSGQYNLKPVIAVIPVLSDAGLRVVGFVDPSIASSANVSVQLDGLPVKATTPDATGKFVLYPVPAGTYDLVVTSAGHVTAVMTGVPVITTAFTNVNSAEQPIAPPISTERTVDGTVMPTTATVRALQKFTVGPPVEVAWGSVNATTGGFVFTLPNEAPVKKAYADPSSPGFAPDTGAAGMYTIEAVSNGVPKSTQITPATMPPVDFTF